MKLFKKSRKKKKAPIKFKKVIVTVCILVIVLYTTVQVVLNYLTGIELSPVLTTCVYAFFGTELAACAAIDIFKKEDNDEKEKNKDPKDNSVG